VVNRSANPYHILPVLFRKTNDFELLDNHSKKKKPLVQLLLQEQTNITHHKEHIMKNKKF